MSNTKLAPGFELSAETPRSSKTPLVIGGIQAYIYGLTEVSGDEIAVLYLAHGRTRSYLDQESVAHEVLHKYRNDARKNIPMIAVAFDMRNHGARQISEEANAAWAEGNKNHGPDMMSTIDGSVHDFKLLLDYMPTYLPFKKFHNTMMGVSLGGHIAWRLPLVAKEQLDGLVVIVGCPELNKLMLSRLGAAHAPNYEELQLTADQRAKWPATLFNSVERDDDAIRTAFPQIPMLLCTGKRDTLVPSSHTENWLSANKRDNVDLFVQQDAGHVCTNEMVASMADWLCKLNAGNNVNSSI